MIAKIKFVFFYFFERLYSERRKFRSEIENNLKRILLKDNNLNLYHKYYIHLPKIRTMFRQFH